MWLSLFYKNWKQVVLHIKIGKVGTEFERKLLLTYDSVCIEEEEEEEEEALENGKWEVNWSWWCERIGRFNEETGQRRLRQKLRWKFENLKGFEKTEYDNDTSSVCKKTNSVIKCSCDCEVTSYLWIVQHFRRSSIYSEFTILPCNLIYFYV